MRRRRAERSPSADPRPRRGAGRRRHQHRRRSPYRNRAGGKNSARNPGGARGGRSRDRMRPGRAADLPALSELWSTEVREGRRDSMPRLVELQRLLAHFDWEAQSRVVDDGPAGIAGAIVVTSRSTPVGTFARIDPAAAGTESARVIQDLVRWGVQLSRAAGAVSAQVWVGPGKADVLRTSGLEMVRPWWRMD